MTESVNTVLSEEQIAEIERDALSSPLSTFPLTTEQALALCQTVKALRADVTKFSGLADKRHDELSTARRQRDDLAANFDKYTRELLQEFRSRAIALCKAKAEGYRKSAEGSLAREIWMDCADVMNGFARELEALK